MGEFYQNRDIPEDVKLELEKFYGTYYIQNKGRKSQRVNGLEITDQEKLEEARARNEIYLNEFKEFTGFLKDKFFAG